MTKKLIGILTLAFSCVSCAAVDPQTKMQQIDNQKNRSSATTKSLNESFTWLDGGKKRTAWFDSEYVVEVGVSSNNTSNTRQLKETNIKKAGFSQANQVGDMIFWKRTNASKNRSAIKSLQASDGLLPVYRSSPTTDSGYSVPVGGVLVQMEDGKTDILKNWAKQNNKKLSSVAGGVAWLIESEPGEAAIELTTELMKLANVKTVTPNWRLPISTR
jgi:hypothetical protein